MPYAFAGEVGNNKTYPHPSQSKIAQVESKWEPGFKIGAGLEFEHDGWDLFVEWTWLNPITNNTSSVKQEDNPHYYTFQPLNYQYQTAVNLASVNQGSTRGTTKGSWELHYNVIDLELGRNFFLSPKLTLRPHIGLKSAWINQKYNILILEDNFTATLGNTSVITQPGFTAARNQSLQSWGLGICFGLDSGWRLSRNWGIYGNVALSSLYEYYTTKQKQYFQGDILVNNQLTSFNYLQGDIKQNNHTLTPVLELGLGLEYMKWFYDEAYMLELKAGWEHQIWFGTNQFQYSSTQGNLTLQGFTFKAGFHF
jgi:hypothetical protein